MNKLTRAEYERFLRTTYPRALTNDAALARFDAGHIKVVRLNSTTIQSTWTLPGLQPIVTTAVWREARG